MKNQARLFSKILFIYLCAIFPLSTASAQDPMSIDGVLIKGIIDLENGESQEMAHIRETRSGKTFNIELKNGKLPKKLRELENGQRVVVRGKRQGQSQSLSYDSAEEVQSGPRVAQDLLRRPLVHGPGERTMLAVMVDFNDDQAVCGTEETMHKVLFDKNEPKSLVNWVDKTSHGKFSVTGEVVRVHIDVNGASAGCQYNDWADLADAALREKGINPDNWDHQQYVLPKSSQCSFGGVAYLGYNHSWVRQCYAKTFSHELGHNFGMGHANDDHLGAYGDYTDTMGRYFFELNAPHREQMGWTPNAKILMAGEDMTARIAPLNTLPADTELPQIIKVKRPTADDYAYISFRNNTGPWDTSLGSDYYNKVSIHHYKADGRDPHTYLMETIGPGESYTIEDGNIVVKNIAVTEDYVEVQIAGATGEPCVRKAPTLELPSTVQTIEAGKSFGGMLKVTNNNSIYCSPETFKVEIAPVSGVSFSMAASEISLASGSRYNAEFLVQTEYSLGAGDHEQPIRALNKDHPELVHQSKIAFKTVLATDKIDPDVKITSPSAGAQIEAMTDVSFKAHATDNVGVTKVEFLVNSNKVCEDASYPYECQFKMIEGKDVQLIARAYDKAGNFKADMILIQGMPAADKIAPSIKINSPSALSEHYVGGILKVQMSASDNVGVEKTSVYLNGILKCEDNTSPYECAVTVPQGESQLMARAYDKAGNFKSEIIKIIGKVNTPDTSAPTVRLDSPSNGAEYKAGSMIKAAASASDDKGVVKVEFFVNDVRKCRLYSLPYICEFSMPEQATKVYAIAYDAAGNSAKSDIATIGNTVTVDEIPPTLNVTSPADNTKVKAGSKVMVKVDAKDNIGVNRVAFYQFNTGSDYGFFRRCDIQAPPYECEMQISEGSSRIYAYAWDKAGNLGRTSVSIEGVASVVIDNESPKADILAPTKGQAFSAGEVVSVKVDASDNVAVKEVKIYWKHADGYWKYICSKNSAPYTCSFKMPDQEEVTILAFALDTSGNRMNRLTSIAKEGADSERPEVKVVSHTSGQVVKTPQKAVIEVSATDNIGVSKVQVLVRSSYYGTGYKMICSFDSSPYKCPVELVGGANYIYVKAYDKAGNVSYQMLNIKGSSTGEKDETRPVTKLLGPSNGSSVKVGETFTVKMSASDNVGVTRMRLYVWHESTGYKIYCDTPNANEVSCPIKALKGEMRIMPRAYDSAGNFHSVLYRVYGK